MALPDGVDHPLQMLTGEHLLTPDRHSWGRKVAAIERAEQILANVLGAARLPRLSEQAAISTAVAEDLRLRRQADLDADRAAARELFVAAAGRGSGVPTG